MGTIYEKPIPASDISQLKAAVDSRRRSDAKLLVIDGDNFSHRQVDDLSVILRADDLLVVNDVGTMPSQLVGRVGEREVQLRLALHLGAGPSDVGRWLVVSIGNDAWSVKTENRAPGYRFRCGEIVSFGGTLKGVVVEVVDGGGLLVEMEFSSDGDLFSDLYSAGTPIQYAHLTDAITDWDQQTIFTGPFVAVEPPASAFHLTWQTVFELRERGVEIATLTHATGLSTTGDDCLDRQLPFPELSIIPESTAKLVNRAKAERRRVIAIGTGVTRALESSVLNGTVAGGSFTSLVKLSSERRPQIVDGLLSGLHEPGSSHLSLLEAFVSPKVLGRAYSDASRLGYLGHEYGDLELVFLS